MIPNEKTRSMFRKLLSKSQKAEVNWHEVPRHSPQQGTREAYGVELGDSDITLDLFVPPVEPDYFKIYVTRNGNVVADWSLADDGSAEDDFRLVKQLFLEAKGHVKGWDDVVDQIDAALDQEGPVGALRR
jgi:hypothetical protein